MEDDTYPETTALYRGEAIKSVGLFPEPLITSKDHSLHYYSLHYCSLHYCSLHYCSLLTAHCSQRLDFETSDWLDC